MIEMKTKLLLGLIGDVITNGNKHLGTFENPIIHYPIFNVKNLNLMEKISFKVFNNVLRKEARNSYCKRMISGWHIHCESFDNTKNYAKMDLYCAAFGPF